MIVEIDRSISDTTSQVLLSTRATGGQISDQPFTIVDNGAKTAETYSVYLAGRVEARRRR